MKIREAVVADAKAIQAIYAPYVEQTAVTFEYNVPSEEEFRKRIETVKQKYPWIVAEADGKIVGYAYASAFKPSEQLGYKKVAHFHLCGKKFGRWYDMIWMEKIIGEHIT